MLSPRPKEKTLKHFGPQSHKTVKGMQILKPQQID